MKTHFCCFIPTQGTLEDSECTELPSEEPEVRIPTRGNSKDASCFCLSETSTPIRSIDWQRSLRRGMCSGRATIKACNNEWSFMCASNRALLCVPRTRGVHTGCDGDRGRQSPQLRGRPGRRGGLLLFRRDWHGDHSGHTVPRNPTRNG